MENESCYRQTSERAKTFLVTMGPQSRRVTRERCYDFLKYFRRKIQRKNWRFKLKTKLYYAKF
jgi:hypothetical protein